MSQSGEDITGGDESELPFHTYSTLRSGTASNMNPSVGLSGIRRTRPSYSCENCRLRRIGCDKVHPSCSNCTRSGAVCTYSTLNLKRKSPSEDSPSDKGSKSSKRKVVDETAHLRHGHLSLQNGGRSRYTENTFWACVDTEGLELDSLLSDLPLFPLEAVCCTADEMAQKKSRHKPSCRHFVGTTEPNFSFWVTKRPNVVQRDSRSLAGLLRKLPNKAICDGLYATFLNGVHPLIPLIYLPAFDKQYQRFWEWYELGKPGDVPQGVLLENPSFLPLLLAVLFAGSLACNKEMSPCSPSVKIKNLRVQLYNLSQDALTLVGFPHSPAIYSLIAYLLIQSMLIVEEESLSSVSFVAVAFRICQAMGIHKDGSYFGLDPVQVEERRRVWCHLMHLDVMTSIISGLPLVSSAEAFCNTQMIGELRDEFIGKSIMDGKDPSYLYPGYILAAGRYDATSCIRNILIRQFAPRPMRLSDVKNLKLSIEQLSTRMLERIKRLSLATRASTSAANLAGASSPARKISALDSSASPEAFDSWSRDLLSLMLSKAHCILYQPLMSDAQLWETLRAEAIPHFQSYIATFLRLCSASSSYNNFQWLYPGAYQPLQQAAVLLVDLAKEPESKEAEESRVLLEQVFALLGPDGRISVAPVGLSGIGRRIGSKGAKNAWERLERLRRKVWKKLGLDPEVMWGRTITRGADSVIGMDEEDDDDDGDDDDESGDEEEDSDEDESESSEHDAGRAYETGATEGSTVDPTTTGTPSVSAMNDMFGNIPQSFSENMEQFSVSGPSSTTSAPGWLGMQRDAVDMACDMLGPDYTLPDWMSFQGEETWR